MTTKNDAYVPARITRLRYKDLDEACRIRLQRSFSAPLSKGARILFAGAPGSGQGSAGRTAFLAYNDPREAFLLARAPLLLGVRGEVQRVPEGGLFYIPPDRKALLADRLKHLAAAAAVILALSAGAWFLLARGHEEGVPLPEYGDVAAILEGGYKTLADLPEEYFTYVPRENLNVLYAAADEISSGDRTRTEEKVIDKVLDYIDSAGGGHDIHDRRLIAFYDRVVRNGEYSPRIRYKAFSSLCETAAFFYLPVETAKRYRESDVPEIRKEARMVIEGGRWAPLILPGTPR